MAGIFDPENPTLVELNDLAQARAFVSALRKTGRPVNVLGFAATMLHTGHQAVIEAANRLPRAVTVVCFARAITAEDIEFCSRAGANAVVSLPPQEVWPQGRRIDIVPRLFDGDPVGMGSDTREELAWWTTLIVALRPSDIVIGEKDRELLVALTQVVSDFRADVVVHGVPVVRDRSGLALSSSTQGLPPDLYEDAVALSAAMTAAGRVADKGAAEVIAVVQEILSATQLRDVRVRVVDTQLRGIDESRSGADHPDCDGYVLIDAMAGDIPLRDSMALTVGT